MFVYLDKSFASDTPNQPNGGWGVDWTMSLASGATCIKSGTPNVASLLSDTNAPGSVFNNVMSSGTTTQELTVDISSLTGTGTYHEFRVRNSGNYVTGYWLQVSGTSLVLGKGPATPLATGSWTPPSSWGGAAKARVRILAAGSNVSAKIWDLSGSEPGWMLTAADSTYANGLFHFVTYPSPGGAQGEMRLTSVGFTDGQPTTIKTVTEGIGHADGPVGKTATASDSLALTETAVNTGRSVVETLGLADAATFFALSASHSGAESLSFAETATRFDLTRYRFIGPTTRGPRERRTNGLFRRMNIPVGLTVLKEHGFWKTTQNAEAERLAAAERYFMGGHAYPIDGATYAELAAAGYGAYCTPDI